MVKAELNYNPYLLETSIKFNGQEPRINSLVEKFQDDPLQSWVRRIPEIFYDEMNGYDFELEFSGTERDYQEVVHAFREKGITDESVRIFHKNELDGRSKKVELLACLLEWLEKNQNRNFNFTKFQEEHADCLNSSCVYIIFQGSQLNTTEIDDTRIDIEQVNIVDELNQTELKNIPILIYITEENIDIFQSNLEYFMKRKDVKPIQLFFLIHPSLDSGKVERIIRDLGISEPNVVTGVYEDKIKKYIEIYPISEYIYSVISLFRKITEELDGYLKRESEKSAIHNKEIHERIDLYENNIRRLKEAHHNFITRDNLEIPGEWNDAKNELLELLSNWRKRKTKITDSYEAEMAANESEADTKRYYSQFLEKMVRAATTTKQDIDVAYDAWYKNAEFDRDYQVTRPVFAIPNFENEINVSEVLQKLVEEEYVKPKEDIFGMFFKSTADTSKEPIFQKVFYYQNWRDYVMNTVSPKTESVIETLFENIQQYEQVIAENYMVHLAELIEKETSKKDQEAEKLSDEERLLQNDIDWLEKVQDQLKKIERG